MHGLSKIVSGGRDCTRELVRIRDNHTCQICGKIWEPGKRRLDVHHKDFDKEKSQKYERYEEEQKNMITLCHKCHLNLPGHKRQMSLSRIRKKLSTSNI